MAIPLRRFRAARSPPGPMARSRRCAGSRQVSRSMPTIQCSPHGPSSIPTPPPVPLTMICGDRDRSVVGQPGAGIVGLCLPPWAEVRDLRQLAVALFIAPRHPLRGVGEIGEGDVVSVHVERLRVHRAHRVDHGDGRSGPAVPCWRRSRPDSDNNRPVEVLRFDRLAPSALMPERPTTCRAALCSHEKLCLTAFLHGRNPAGCS